MIGGSRKRTEQNLAYSPHAASGDSSLFLSILSLKISLVKRSCFFGTFVRRKFDIFVSGVSCADIKKMIEF